MSYPYYSLPLQLYEHLPEVLRESGLEVSIPPARSCSLSEHTAGPPTKEDEESRVVFAAIEGEEIKIICYYDAILGEYTAYALLVCNSKPLPKLLRQRLSQVLERHGAELK